MKIEFSAGGIVIKKAKNKNEILRSAQDDISILVCQHSQHHGWVFPKGLIDEKETKEKAALREAQEETGVKGKIIQALTPITYCYNLNDEKRQKTVYYFLMEYVSGDITKHDWEMENVEWLPVNKVEERLTYDSDKQVWYQAKKMLSIA